MHLFVQFALAERFGNFWNRPISSTLVYCLYWDNMSFKMSIFLAFFVLTIPFFCSASSEVCSISFLSLEDAFYELASLPRNRGVLTMTDDLYERATSPGFKNFTFVLLISTANSGCGACAYVK